MMKAEKNSLDLDLVEVRGGSFLVIKKDGTLKEYQVPDFSIGRYPVTQELWNLILGEEQNKSGFEGDKRPVEGVTTEKLTIFLGEISRLLSANIVVPTTQQWLFAASGGNFSQNFTYAGSDAPKEVAWWDKNSHGETKPVGLKSPNELGLYEMSGNVWEITRASSEPESPHLLCGGAYDTSAEGLRIREGRENAIKWPSYEYEYPRPSIGFRVAMF